MGIIFNIQKFCTSDGPGIRTTVFLKGCPLSCIWCHNPESKNLVPQLMYQSNLCVGCGKCVSLCPRGCHTIREEGHQLDRKFCVGCGRCINVTCKALSLSGYERTAEEVMTEVLKDKPFYDNSGGGITVSGGEPLFQYDFTTEILKLAKQNGLHTCMETCGYADSEKLKKLLPLVDLFLFDIKETDSEKHKKFTGVRNEKILENLKMIDQNGAKTVLRCPIISSCNDTPEHFAGIAALANSMQNLQGIDIEPYHSLGESKYTQLGVGYRLTGLEMPEENRIESWIAAIQRLTEKKVSKA